MRDDDNDGSIIFQLVLLFKHELELFFSIARASPYHHYSSESPEKLRRV